MNDVRDDLLAAVEKWKAEAEAMRKERDHWKSEYQRARTEHAQLAERKGTEAKTAEARHILWLIGFDASLDASLETLRGDVVRHVKWLEERAFERGRPHPEEKYSWQGEIATEDFCPRCGGHLVKVPWQENLLVCKACGRRWPPVP